MSYVIVRVWVSRVRKVSPGHASLAIFPHSSVALNGYVSFAPVKSGSIHGPGKFYPFAHDRAEYMCATDDGVRGCWTGKIYGLDAKKMMREFLRDQRRAQTYSLLNECATQVHRYLVVGGGDRLASAWARRAVLFWSPDDVEDYARSIVAHTRRLGSFGHKVVGAGTLF
ncbi:MAG TPA: hypothetical protein VGY58_10980 [Gemmataceae bacterium]|jgi:hypothetical protein|nr:hypothetical protein [Gemmataceae bacterium]